MTLLKRMKIACVVLALSLCFTTPVLAATIYPTTSMSTSYTKYYSAKTTLTAKNFNDNTLFTYKIVPIWRINSSNSINSTTCGSTFTKSAWWSLWKLIDTDYDWNYYTVNKRNVEAYYAEGVAVGFGLTVNGNTAVNAATEKTSANLSVSASATLGQAYTFKYIGTATTKSSWSSCSYVDRLY